LANYVERKQSRPFREVMNQEAQGLGMADSHFSNPLGFDSDTNYSTASDLKLLVEATRQYRAFTLVSRENVYEFNSAGGNFYRVKATNTLLKADPEVFAIKTGYTDLAQGSMITEVHHNGQEFVIIVLNTPDREGDTLALKKAVLSAYSWPK